MHINITVEEKECLRNALRQYRYAICSDIEDIFESVGEDARNPELRRLREWMDICSYLEKHVREAKDDKTVLGGSNE